MIPGDWHKKFPCGCSAYALDTTVSLTGCNLHNAAPSLLRSAEKALEFLECRFSNKHGDDWGDEGAAYVADLLEAAITQAKGTP